MRRWVRGCYCFLTGRWKPAEAVALEKKVGEKRQNA
jgi:hypothetical protein